MKKKKLLPAIVFLVYLAAMLLGTVLLPAQRFSENEKRFLAEFPDATPQSVFSGDWGSGLEKYLADHLPARDFFVGLHAYYNLALGQQGAAEIRLTDGRLVEAPTARDFAAADSHVQAVNRLADALGRPVHLALVPSAGWALGGEAYSDGELIAAALSGAGENVVPVDLTGVFSGHPELYYRTDHHWNSLGAWKGYQAVCTALGREALPETAFTREVLPACFRGSTYSRSALWLTKPEDLELWHGTAGITVENGEQPGVHDGVFYRERLEEADKYTVFLDGNHSLVRIHNPEKTGKLLVIRDSFSNSLGCFLAESYGEVVLVDLRYYKSPVSLLAQEGFDDVLVLYSLNNFLTDANIILLR